MKKESIVLELRNKISDLQQQLLVAQEGEKRVQIQLQSTQTSLHEAHEKVAIGISEIEKLKEVFTYIIML
jgi:hypothetical protein